MVDVDPATLTQPPSTGSPAPRCTDCDLHAGPTSVRCASAGEVDLRERWAGLQPFSEIAAEALDHRLGRWSPDPDLGDHPGPVEAKAVGSSQRLETSRAAWLVDEPEAWPLLALWPLLDQAETQMRNAAARFEGSFEIDRDSFCRSYIVSATANLGPLVARVVADHVAPLADLGASEAATEAAMVAHLVHHFGDRGACETFAACYSALFRVIDRAVGALVASFEQLLARLVDDRVALADLAAEAGRLVVASVAGDVHEDGAVTVLHFEHGNRLVYKPRSLGVDAELQRFFAWLGDRGIPAVPRVPRLVDRGNHGWQEYVDHRESVDLDEVDAFYYRVGVLLATAYLCRGSDLHFENIRCDGASPVLVDAECFFGTSTDIFDDDALEFAEPSNESVLGVALLPGPRQVHRGAPVVDMSALGGVPGIQYLPHRPTIARGDDGVIQIGHVPLGPPVIDHLPVFDGSIRLACDHEAHLVAGFEQTYQVFLEHRDELQRDDGALGAFRSVRVRHLVRATSLYARLGNRLGDPEAASCSLAQEEVVNALWSFDAHLTDRMQVVFDCERSALLAGRIPSFARNADGTNARCGSVAIPLLHRTSGYDLVMDRVSSLCERDRDFQVQLIAASVSLLRGEWERRYHGSYEPLTHAPIDREVLVREATRLARTIDAMASGSGDDRWWPVCHQLAGKHALQGAAIDLYNGRSGLALLFGYLDLATTGELSTTTVTLVDGLRSWIDQVVGRVGVRRLVWSGQGGAYNGFWGCVYVAASLGISAGDVDLTSWAVDRAVVLCDGIDDLDDWDLMSGTAGVLCLVAALADVSGDERLRRATARAADHLGAQVEDVFRRRTIVAGLAHGLSGVALAFARSAVVLDDPDSVRAAAVVLDAERTTCDWDDRGWRDARMREADLELGLRKMEGWCRGAAGIGLSRVSMQGLFDRFPGGMGQADLGGDLLTREIDLAESVLVERGFGANHSLCHGALGMIEFLLARELASGTTHGRAEHLAGAVVSGTEGEGWRTGAPIGLPAPGLLDGYAGIALGLLRNGFPDRVPDVLTLDLPRRRWTPS